MFLQRDPDTQEQGSPIDAYRKMYANDNGIFFQLETGENYVSDVHIFNY